MDHAAALLDEHNRLADLLTAADWEADVATCPGWTVRKTVNHIGRGHRWAATMVAEGATERLEFRDVPDGKAPDDPDAAIAWLAGSVDDLLAVVAADPDAPVWTFIGPRPASWWVRRRLHEATAHRADIALALGESVAYPPELAADGLSEWLDLLAARGAHDTPPLGDGQTLHLHAADAGAEWLLRGSGNAVTWTAEHAHADAGVHGDATTLFLMTLRRLPADTLPVHGDASVWNTWLERTGF